MVTYYSNNVSNIPARKLFDPSHSQFFFNFSFCIDFSGLMTFKEMKAKQKTKKKITYTQPHEK